MFVFFVPRLPTNIIFWCKGSTMLDDSTCCSLKEVVFFDFGHLLGCQLDAYFRIVLFYPEPAVVEAGYVVADNDFLD